MHSVTQAGGFLRNLKDRVALVTGAASGIARATAQRFAGEGATVIVADGSLPGGLETVKLIQAEGGRASFTEVDVSQSDQVNRMVESAINQHGQLDVLFNGAAILFYGTVLDTGEEAWNRMLSINLNGTLSLLPGGHPAHDSAGPRIDHQHCVDRRRA